MILYNNLFLVFPPLLFLCYFVIMSIMVYFRFMDCYKYDKVKSWIFEYFGSYFIYRHIFITNLENSYVYCMRDSTIEMEMFLCITFCYLNNLNWCFFCDFMVSQCLFIFQTTESNHSYNYNILLKIVSNITLITEIER